MNRTEREVREELPDVTVRAGKQHYRAKVTGRKCPFATVTPLDGPHKDQSQTYSWCAVTRAINAGRPLLWI
jgi:hypothetical protein